ncbi:pentatricopeptide repeat-containing protein At4g33170 [Cornus florida]|uniref:pentatricopeptide repeat-containing protein At4g33170 n=1 Tax=Cornus florida TaxID=4283 RepID=UPI0028979656|nr:pentatricopeptide repeat-containing protein At4g33170 [Cornus florida]
MLALHLQAKFRPAAATSVNTLLSVPLLHRHLSKALYSPPPPNRSSSSSSSSSEWFPFIRTAISTNNLLLGNCVHALVVTCGHRADRFVTNNLITMYSKCGSLSSARLLFDNAPQRDLVTWNSILAAYAHAANSDDDHGIQEGFCLFRQFRWSAALASKLTLAPVLKLCLMSGYEWASETVHGYAIKISLEWDAFVSGALVNIYSKFGRVRDARVLFNGMPETEKDIVLWNVMLKTYGQMGLKKEAFLLFSELHRSELRPDDVSVRCVLGGLSEVEFDEGNKYAQQVQAYATKLFLQDDTSDIISWNKYLPQYQQAGENLSTVECFRNMHRSNVGFDSETFVVALAAVIGINDSGLGQQIHGMAVKLGFDLDVTVANNLINMYSKTGYLGFAQKVFTTMKELNLVSWNSMISSCVQSGLEEESVTLFREMLNDGLKPDHFTLASVLRACSSLTAGLCLSEQVHVLALKTAIISDAFVSTALIDVYSRNRRMEGAELLFQNKDEFDSATWNAMMHGYIICNNGHKALKLFAMMHKSGERSDEITLATVAKACGCLVWLEQGRQIHDYIIKVGVDSDLCVSGGILDMYIKCGDMVDAYRVFQGIPAPDDIAWTTIISGCVENGDEDRAFSMYHQMRQSGVAPDEYTFATLIKASSYLTALEPGRQIHANLIKSDCASDPFVGTSLIDMYAKCGNIEDSYCLFKSIDVRNIALWNAMLVGLAQHGHGREALNVFKDMKHHGIKPDRVTFIGVLSACSHSGLTSQAYMYFRSMYKDYGIQPEIEHYSCLVDALGRAGLVQEAENLIASMPFEASASMYRALLGACWVQGDTEIGKRVATQLLALEPLDSAAYVLLSNIYAASNQWNEVTDVRKMMKTKNVKKDPGFSWIDV